MQGVGERVGVAVAAGEVGLSWEEGQAMDKRAMVTKRAPRKMKEEGFIDPFPRYREEL
jgi:hypothetical protein